MRGRVEKNGWNEIWKSSWDFSFLCSSSPPEQVRFDDVGDLLQGGGRRNPAFALKMCAGGNRLPPSTCDTVLGESLDLSEIYFKYNRLFYRLNFRGHLVLSNVFRRIQQR